MLPNIGPMEFGILLLLGLLLFGKRLPDVGRALGQSILEFRKAISGAETAEVVAQPTHPTTDR